MMPVLKAFNILGALELENMPMLHGGKVAILSIFGVAIAMAAFAWWHHFQEGRRSLELWGSQSAQLIEHAPHVEVLQLEDARAGREVEEAFDVNSQPLAIAQRTDISAARGLLHARHALIQDASFDWTTAQEDCEPQWQIALRFSGTVSHATMVLDFRCRRAYLVERDKQATLTKVTADALQRFIEKTMRH
jgi:hypothetical protein